MQESVDAVLHHRYQAPYRLAITVFEAQQLANQSEGQEEAELFVFTPRNLPLNTSLDLGLHLPDGKRDLRCRARIEQRPDAHEGYRVVVEELDAADALSYLERVDAISKGRAELTPAVYQVLLVEDNAMVCQTVQKALPVFWLRTYPGGPGIKIDICDDATTALRCLEEKCYHLVISDVFMPNLDGRTLLTTMRGQNSTALIPMLAISGGDVADELIRLDADAYLSKPLRVQELFDTVHLLMVGQPGATEANASDSPLATALSSF